MKRRAHPSPIAALLFPDFEEGTHLLLCKGYEIISNHSNAVFLLFKIMFQTG